MRICVVGAGYVGVTTATVLAEDGHRVDLVELDAKKRDSLAQGDVPFYEPGLPEAFKRALAKKTIRLHPSLDHVQAAPQVVLLCVGTPMAADGDADLRFLSAAAADAARRIKTWKRPIVLATKSTVPPGTGRGVVAAAAKRFLRLGRDVSIASNPEFLSEGNALQEARRPDRVVLGVEDAWGEKALRRLYASSKCPVLVTNLETAETIKYAANAMLATRIAFANEVANLCERVGVNVDAVMQGIGLDARIGPKFLRAGLGFGGSCFPKDVSAFATLGRKHGITLGLLEAVLKNNETQPLRAVELLRELGGPLRGRRIAVLGLAFKPHTSDVRETRALAIIQKLRSLGATVVATDPVAVKSYKALDPGRVEYVGSARAALKRADGCILVTEWPQFARLTPAAFRTMKRRIVVDGRRALDAEALRKAGVRYAALGRGDLRVR